MRLTRGVLEMSHLDDSRILENAKKRNCLCFYCFLQTKECHIKIPDLATLEMETFKWTLKWTLKCQTVHCADYQEANRKWMFSW